MNTTQKKLLAMALSAVCFVVPVVVVADTVTVTNTVHTSSSSGGNTASGGAGSNGVDGVDGAVVNGEVMSSVLVETTINGEVVEHHEEVSTDPIKYSHTSSQEDLQVLMSASTAVGSEEREMMQPEEVASTSLHAEEVEIATGTVVGASKVLAFAYSVRTLVSSVIAYVFGWF